MFSLDETIIACGTAHGSALRGVLRLSGDGSVRAVEGLFHCESPWNHCEQLQQPRIFCGTLTPWEPERKIPCELYFWPQGRGYTGQKSVELHLWGSEPILDAVLQRILASEHESVRLANPGEFTLRAFLAGRLDLTQAEAVLGVIDANDISHLNVALKQLAGGVGQPLHQVREDLIETLAHLEAGFDFVDEEIEFISQNELLDKIQSAIATLQKILKQITTRNLSGKTVRVLLTGAPNAGKSSLFNSLADQNQTNKNQTPNSAIVSEIPGTTRDYLETPLTWNGIELKLIDSAGIENDFFGNSLESTVDDFLRKSPSVSEKLTYQNETPDDVAQQFSRRILDESDLLVYCMEGQTAFFPYSLSSFGPKPVILYGKPTILVLTKCDQQETTCSAIRTISKEEPDHKEIGGSDFDDGFLKIVETSAKTGQGINVLKTTILEWILKRFGTPEVVPATAVRCRDAIEKSIRSLNTALKLTEQNRDEMLVASELRIALEQLGQVLGVVHTDDLLDRIFSNFCIGK